ncbi:hypothetical protein [Bizionia myxarmorum]|uniref:Cytochrome c n=1 Tax=Bizionia myxarmorum TaxID=291186 RepID=A0A5D0RF13_9FLAO|nr:hypothetical protein [Bizionia myxarmorum]TYB79546.1 hypothetical protein ES674_07250 [Bizionia myxarmorum]
MKQILGLLVILFFMFGCNNSEEKMLPEKVEKQDIVYDMYEPSEMANLMNQMYAYNLTIKNAIVAGEDIEEFPLDFLKIHSAELSDFKKRNLTFESFSKLFIDAEKELYNPDSEISETDRFNNVVNLCISCHQTECTGPIPRIKKLLIQ